MDVFEDFSILAEKQRLKPRKSNSLMDFASLDTQLDPKVARLVEIYPVLHFFLKFSKMSKIQPNSAILRWFFEVCSILSEKQRMKPKKSNSLMNFASLDTLLDRQLARLVETKKKNHTIDRLVTKGFCDRNCEKLRKPELQKIRHK